MAPSPLVAAFLGLLSLTAAQQIGSADKHPRLRTQKCTTAGGCVTQNTAVVIDSGSHPLIDKRTGKSCRTSSGAIDTTICNSVESCGRRCEYQGTDYARNGVRTSGDSLYLRQYLRQNGQLVKVSPRLYLLQENRQEYVMMQLVNQELSFDVDMSNLPCGMNAALYLGEMESDGGRATYNPAGATYGTGYCDAQCYVPTWLNGALNTEGRGACCNEMDVWESNSRATTLVPHPCKVPGFYGCEGEECSLETGVCDKYGCGYNPYALGDQGYYGLGSNFTIDTNRVFTVTTQFISANGKANGRLKEIRRNYIQDGQLIHQAVVTVDDKEYDSITPALCKATAAEYFGNNGGLRAMGQALARGMVLTFSIWNDDGGFMTWLDAGNNGPCSDTEGDPQNIIATVPDTDVTFSAVKWGDIGSTTRIRG